MTFIVCCIVPVADQFLRGCVLVFPTVCDKAGQLFWIHILLYALLKVQTPSYGSLAWLNCTVARSIDLVFEKCLNPKQLPNSSEQCRWSLSVTVVVSVCHGAEGITPCVLIVSRGV